MDYACLGRPFIGHLHSADASAGVAIPIREQGNETDYTLLDNEYLEITDVIFVSAPGGDCFVHTGTAADATPDDHKTVLRATVGTNGGAARGADFKFVAIPGDTLFMVAPGGVVDVHVKGHIRAVGSGERASWKHSLVPGV